ncbi:MAG: Diadenosine tetraphosphate (Ap4A) hydrolase and other HIT family hydrolases [uncultured Thiotrichaceae bacterium]|uniref:Diadenosine tetraphosphate (Ap4A) hydrolase and other HIT family hydrolases n=1 Tax=uncultured Thiotrichaceae bacterium TaxID=298394 RepID=A0A6S6S1X3_9GAMM|nr:MAG: Diadenosine tetraphosphate (Ap4A) hydrolase and other HIT family hydrolases [uncultured Thiotrichaceae bacterium]
MKPIYQNAHVYIEVETSEIPWLKIFTQETHKEFSDCDADTRQEIFRLLDIIEKEMIAYFKPEKINIASFANYLPHVHWHIMARFKTDSYFPEPMWGEKQREGNVHTANFDIFISNLVPKL